MLNISGLNPQHTYSVLLRNGGAIIGTLIFPIDGISQESLGGFRIIHSRTAPTIKKDNLHFFTLDVGIGVYEVLIPLSEIYDLYRLSSIDEQILRSPQHELWKKLGVHRTWRIPFGRLLVDKSTQIIRDRKLKFRPVVELPDVASMSHPVSFPRYPPFRPKYSIVIYPRLCPF